MCVCDRKILPSLILSPPFFLLNVHFVQWLFPYYSTHKTTAKTTSWFHLLTHFGKFLLVEQFHLGENSSYTSLSSYGVTVGMNPRNGGFLLFVPTSAGRSLCYFSLLHVEDITLDNALQRCWDFCSMCPLAPWVITWSSPLTVKRITNYAGKTSERISRTDGIWTGSL